MTKEELETLDYLMGWFETHPDEYPQSFDEMLELIRESRHLVEDSNNDLEQ